jgi:hypothetical protein
VASEGLKKASNGKKAGRPEKYYPDFVKALSALWDFFDFPCGKLFSPLLRGIINYPAGGFNLDEKTRAPLCSISPAGIDRKLKKHKERYRFKDIHTTKPGSLLKSRIPVRVCFDQNEKKPGYFEFDTVSHCGAQAQGQLCQTLTITDAGSGWTQECALLNKGHRWVKV